MNKFIKKQYIIKYIVTFKCPLDCNKLVMLNSTFVSSWVERRISKEESKIIWLKSQNDGIGNCHLEQYYLSCHSEQNNAIPLK